MYVTRQKCLPTTTLQKYVNITIFVIRIIIKERNLHKHRWSRRVVRRSDWVPPIKFFSSLNYYFVSILYLLTLSNCYRSFILDTSNSFENTYVSKIMWRNVYKEAYRKSVHVEPLLNHKTSPQHNTYGYKIHTIVFDNNLKVTFHVRGDVIFLTTGDFLISLRH